MNVDIEHKLPFFTSPCLPFRSVHFHAMSLSHVDDKHRGNEKAICIVPSNHNLKRLTVERESANVDPDMQPAASPPYVHLVSPVSDEKSASCNLLSETLLVGRGGGG